MGRILLDFLPGISVGKKLKIMISGKNTLTIFTLLILTFSISFFSYSAAEEGPSIFFDTGTYSSELQQRVERAGAGVVMIVAYNAAGEETGSGSGFFIDSNGRILTNEFILRDAYSAEVFSGSNHYSDVTILRRDRAADLALIRVRATGEFPLEFDVENRTKPGDKVLAVGRSRALKKTASDGLVISVIKNENSVEIINIETLSALNFQDAKDGPLLNAAGKVIGITTTRNLENHIFGPDAIVTDQRKPWAVSTVSITAFLSSSAQAEQLHPAGSKDFTVLMNNAAMNVFIVLYTFSFVNILLALMAVILFISFLQWVYYRFKKTCR